MRTGWLAVVSGAYILLAAPASAATSYTMSFLPDLPGGEDNAFFTDLNNTGTVSGTVAGAPYVWSPSGGWQALAAPGGYATPEALNDAGAAAGGNVGSVAGAATWAPDGSVVPLPPLEPGGALYALDINAGGDIVGYGETGGSYAGFVRRADGSVAPLAAFDGGDYSAAFGMNNLGDVVGESGSLADGWSHAALWSPAGDITDLGLLAGGSYSYGNDINDLGQAIGYGDSADGVQGWIWTTSGGMQPLGNLAGVGDAEAVDINNHGVVVGMSRYGSLNKAWVWTQADGIQSLQDLVVDAPEHWELWRAVAVNDAGQILVRGVDLTGPEGLFYAVLTPEAVPEPATWATLLLGFAAIGATLRRRVRSAVA